MKQPLLFDAADIPRTRPRLVRMHVIDAGIGCGDAEPGEQFVRYACAKCGAETDWESARSISEAKKGVPCHNCNPKGERA